MHHQLIKYIEAYERILIFRHVHGDGDALGSQWALYHYIKNKYPNKEVYALGEEAPGYVGVFEQSHVIEDKMFEDSLALIVDTANQERVDDQRFNLCKQIVKIDHHLPVDDYGVLNIVDEKRSSCAEIVCDLLQEIEEGKPLHKQVAQYLYLGIISDTQGFSISTVSKETFKSASYLMESYISPSQLSQALRVVDIDIFKFQAYAMNQIIYLNDNIAYLMITQDDLKKANLELEKVKFFVNIMKNIRGIQIWALFIEQEDLTYSASLRSHSLNINQVAQEFGGGGHISASGVKNLNLKDIDEMLNKLQELIK